MQILCKKPFSSCSLAVFGQPTRVLSSDVFCQCFYVSVPGPPKSLRSAAVSETSLILQWEPPDQQGGTIIDYKVMHLIQHLS